MFDIPGNPVLNEWPWLEQYVPYLPPQQLFGVVLAAIFFIALGQTLYRAYRSYKIYDKIVKDLDNL
jgi:hypothetical protein